LFKYIFKYFLKNSELPRKLQTVTENSFVQFVSENQV